METTGGVGDINRVGDNRRGWRPETEKVNEFDPSARIIYPEINSSITAQLVGKIKENWQKRVLEISKYKRLGL